MKKLLLLTIFSSLILVSTTAIAATSSRLLTCSNKLGSVVFGICGIRGCPTTVTVGTKATKYNLKRVKNSDGSLNYSGRTGSPSCNISISALRSGLRTARSVSCASKLARSTCKFSDPVAAAPSSSSSSSSSSAASVS